MLTAAKKMEDKDKNQTSNKKATGRKRFRANTFLVST